jgi:hypothetical protein
LIYIREELSCGSLFSGEYGNAKFWKRVVFLKTVYWRRKVLFLLRYLDALFEFQNKPMKRL